VGRDVTVLNDPRPVAGVGYLPVNAFVLHAAEPAVVDTGLSSPGSGFQEALGSVLDPQDVRWIWLTHPDHTGGDVRAARRCPAGACGEPTSADWESWRPSGRCLWTAFC